MAQVRSHPFLPRVGLQNPSGRNLSFIRSLRLMLRPTGQSEPRIQNKGHQQKPQKQLLAGGRSKQRRPFSPLNLHLSLYKPNVCGRRSEVLEMILTLTYVIHWAIKVAYKYLQDREGFPWAQITV